MRRPTTGVICLALALLLFGAGLIWVVLRASLPSAPRAFTSPIASVNFLGYTNDASGTQLATFAVTNLSDITVARLPKCLIWVEVPGGGWMPHSGVLLTGRRVLGIGASEIITITSPAAKSSWRVSF